MNEPEQINLEPPDYPCERCGISKPRLLFDQLSRFLLCESCLESIQRQQSWSLLREADSG